MSVTFADGKFLINDKPVFLYGGEFHYFRVPRAQWQDRLTKLAEAGCNLVSTYIPWLWHEREDGKIDLTGETRAERDLQGFLNLVKSSGLYCIVRPGPYVMSELRNEGIPDWLLQKHPEVMALQRDGKQHPTRVVSYLHPTFLQYVRRWYEAVNSVVAPMQADVGGPVIMYQLCNEIGMLHWVTNQTDFQPGTLARFASYLESVYQSPDKLCETYGIQVSSFAEFVELFHSGGLPAHVSLHFDWRRFWRQYIREYVDVLRAYAVETGIRVPFIINVHGFKDFSIYSRGVDYPIGLSQLYETAKVPDVVLAGDFYPGHIGFDNYHDLILACAYTKAVSHPEQPLFSAEFQSGRLSDRPRVYPSDLDLNARTCVAHGMNALNYYMFVAGENYEGIGLFGRRHEWQAPIDSKGQLRASYSKAQHLGRVLQAIGDWLLTAKKVVHTFVGFNPDDYMTEVVEERDRAMVGEIAAKREHFGFDGLLRSLVLANIHFEAVDLLQDIDPADVPTLWVFSTRYMAPDVQRRLVQYVQCGGRMVIYPEIPLYDLQGRPCRILAEALGLGEWETISGWQTVRVLDIDSVFVRQRLRFHEPQGEVIAEYTGTSGAPEVAAFKKRCERGEVIVLGIGFSCEYGYDAEVVRRIAEVIGVKPHLTSSNPNLSLVERRVGDTSFLFILNYDVIPQAGVILHDGSELFGGEVITLPPLSGTVLVRNLPAGEVKIDYATVELTAIRVTQDEIALTAVPVTECGSISIMAESHWQPVAPLERDGNRLYLGDITGPVEIVLKKMPISSES